MHLNQGQAGLLSQWRTSTAPQLQWRGLPMASTALSRCGGAAGRGAGPAGRPRGCIRLVKEPNPGQPENKKRPGL